MTPKLVISARNLAMILLKLILIRPSFVVYYLRGQKT